MECLAGKGQNKHLVLAVFWALCPLLVIIRTDILSLGLAKLAYPFYVVYRIKFMVTALQRAGGLEHAEALAKMGGAE